MLTPLDEAKIAAIRAREAAGEATLEDFKEVIRILRAGRFAAVAASDGARKKAAKAAVPNADDLLNELENL